MPEVIREERRDGGRGMKKYTIAKYIRLSMEDLDLCDSEEKAESVSISNQRNFINVFTA